MNINKNMENILGFVNQLNQQRMLNETLTKIVEQLSNNTNTQNRTQPQLGAESTLVSLLSGLAQAPQQNQQQQNPTPSQLHMGSSPTQNILSSFSVNNSNEPNWIEKLLNLINLLNSLNIQISDLSQLQEILSFFQEYSIRNSSANVKNSSAAGKNLFGNILLNNNNINNCNNNNNQNQFSPNINQSNQNNINGNIINNSNHLIGNNLINNNPVNNNFLNFNQNKTNNETNNNNNMYINNDITKSNMYSSEHTFTSCYLKENQNTQVNNLISNTNNNLNNNNNNINTSNNSNNPNQSINLTNSLLNSLMSNIINNNINQSQQQQNQSSTASNSNWNANNTTLMQNQNSEANNRSFEKGQFSEKNKENLTSNDNSNENTKKRNRIFSIGLTTNGGNENKNCTFESSNFKGSLFTSTSLCNNLNKSENYGSEMLKDSPKNVGVGMLKKKRLILSRKVDRIANEEQASKDDDIKEEVYDEIEIGDDIFKRKKYFRNSKKNTLCKHFDKKHYAKNMCNKCYHTLGRDKKAWKCGHEDKPHYALGICQTCYQYKYSKIRNRSSKKKKIENPNDKLFCINQNENINNVKENIVIVTKQ